MDSGGHESRPALSWLCGARVQRIDGPFPGCLTLTLYQAGDKPCLVLMYGASTRGVGTISTRPKGEAASAFVQRMRTLFEGGRLSEAAWLARANTPSDRAQALRLTFQRAEARTHIVVDFDASQPNLFLLRADETVSGAANERARRTRFPNRDMRYEPPGGRGILVSEDPEALRGAGEALVQGDAQRTAQTARTRFDARVRTALKRVERRVEAIRGDLARVERAPELRHEAQLLLAHLGTIPRGASDVQLLDETVDPPVMRALALDPARTAQQQAEQRFERARRAERGAAIATARLAEAEHEAAQLRELLARSTAEPLPALAEHAQSLGIAIELERPRPVKAGPPPRIPYRIFFGTGNQRILVGKGAADNDTLTLTVARPHDHWVHVRGATGSHVIVPCERKESVGQQLLLDAAHLAAHFSAQRGEPTVEIQHAERRFVRKPKGAAPGSVNVDRERVFVLRVEPERLAQLLASERKAAGSPRENPA